MTIRTDGPKEKLVVLEAGPMLRLLQVCPALTPREAEAARWMCEGKSNPEIGIILGISTRTVEKHLASLFAKLGVETRLSAVQRIVAGMKGELF